MNRIFDVHVHIFPDRIARKAAQAIGSFYDSPMRHDGTLSTLLPRLDAAGIGCFAGHSVATTPHQVESINRFILEAARSLSGRMLPFAALHPDMEDVKGIGDELVRDGFYGVKLHPDIQGFAIDSPACIRMLSEVEGRLPVLIHAGDDRYDYSNPERLLSLHRALPDLTLILAHMGGYTVWDRAARLLPGHGFYFDISSTLFALDGESAVNMVRLYGADHVFFGSDYPMWDPADEAARFDGLALTQEEKELILYKNAIKLFHCSYID